MEKKLDELMKAIDMLNELIFRLGLLAFKVVFVICIIVKLLRTFL